ncbi:MAG: STAS domain-containing protein [Isosphaeraceae bacterium]|nr:STAS domain-containing protein [Isosphaeraceae bacterium]
MRSTTSDPGYLDAFIIEREGQITIIEAPPTLEKMQPGLVDAAAALLLAPLRREERPRVVVDLSGVDYFNSAFLALLIRCWKLASVKGGVMVVVGLSDRARELLRVTSLDVVWPIYATRREALAALAAGG